MSRSFAVTASRASGGYGPWFRSVNAWVALVLFILTIAAPSARAEPITILGFGDSLMAGYGLSRGSSFPAQLETALRQRGHDVRVINAGVSGDTSAGGKARLGWSLAEKPDAAIVELGANDGLRGLSSEAMRGNLDAILSELRSHRVPVLLAGMQAPPNLGREYADAFRRVYADLAAAHGVIFYPFFLDGVAAYRSLNQDDGMHPSAEGVAVVVDRILPKVEELIVRVKSQRAG